jgi:hypothetical protein
MRTKQFLVKTQRVFPQTQRIANPLQRSYTVDTFLVYVITWTDHWWGFGYSRKRRWFMGVGCPRRVARTYCLQPQGSSRRIISLGLLQPEGSAVRNALNLEPKDIWSHPRRPESSARPLWELQTPCPLHSIRKALHKVFFFVLLANR